MTLDKKKPFSDFQAVARTHAEAEFSGALFRLQSEIDVWPHETADGHPWLIVSMDFVECGAVRDTL
ncbi:hypothetical protein [Myxococcus sp. CA039A]|uniref:hypothetical protein n=1 Tax=Myxococcus sp. CA039A TaxID=2741737 RepID=UPI00157B53BB|nr:hypothetical protein [Myxococcus sp. CA039A]NTX53671.1 hypothetical protein [Myxococcus sp. CA039A]